MGISSGLLRLHGDLLGEEDAENFLIFLSVNAPNIGLSSGLLGKFDPCDMLLSGELASKVLLFFTGVVSVEDNQFERLAPTDTSSFIKLLNEFHL